MRALVVYCHPDPGSFTAAVRDVVLERLAAAGAEVRLHDLHARGFDPVLGLAEWRGYLAAPANRAGVAREVDDLLWCDTLLFVYPTWWYGLPAMLKGWLDRVLLPEVAFLMPDAAHRTIRPGLGHIGRIGVFTTCGASRWLTFLVGAPGRRTLLRGVGFLCAPRRRTVFAAHYLMDSSTPESRAAHLARVAARVDRLAGSARHGAGAGAAQRAGVAE
jgi:putative NADPH-quinone reductase